MVKQAKGTAEDQHMGIVEPKLAWFMVTEPLDVLLTRVANYYNVEVHQLPSLGVVVQPMVEGKGKKIADLSEEELQKKLLDFLVYHVYQQMTEDVMEKIQSQCQKQL